VAALGNQIIKDHDKWRKGTGGAQAGLSGESDGDSYAGLDLDLITIASTHFNGSSFTATTFRDASWSSSQFTGVLFSGCDMANLSITGCTFTHCTFSNCNMQKLT
jgi:fluoroquinolone resistance protein